MDFLFLRVFVGEVDGAVLFFTSDLFLPYLFVREVDEPSFSSLPFFFQPDILYPSY